MATTILALKSSIPTGKIILKVKVASETNGRYVLQDPTGTVEAVITESKSALKYLAVNTFVTVTKPKPIYESGILSHFEMTQDSTVMSCSPFQLDADHQKSEATNPNGASLDDIKDLEPGKVVPEVVLKVVNVKKPKYIFSKESKNFKKTVVQVVIAKDVNGSKTTISLWRDFVNRAKEGQVYKFSRLEVGKFPHVKPHNLTTKFNTSIANVSNEYGQAFQDISCVDGKVTGRVLGISSVIKYNSCNNCWMKIEDNASGCKVCTDPSKNDFYEDYRCRLTIECADETEHEFTGFRRNMGLVGGVTDTPEDDLNMLYAGETVHIEYELSRRQIEETKIIHVITLK